MFSARFLFLVACFFFFLTVILLESPLALHVCLLSNGLHPDGGANDDLIPDCQQEIDVGCTGICLFELCRMGISLPLVFLPNDAEAAERL